MTELFSIYESYKVSIAQIKTEDVGIPYASFSGLTLQTRHHYWNIDTNSASRSYIYVHWFEHLTIWFITPSVPMKTFGSNGIVTDVQLMIFITCTLTCSFGLSQSVLMQDVLGDLSSFLWSLSLHAQCLVWPLYQLQLWRWGKCALRVLAQCLLWSFRKEYSGLTWWCGHPTACRREKHEKELE